MADRAKAPPRGVRRARSPIPPLGIARVYRKTLWAFLDDLNARILDIALDGWDTNPAHHSGAVPKATADSLDSHYVTQKIGDLKLLVADRIKPGTPLSKSIRVLAARVSDHGAIEFRRLVGIKTSDIVIPSLLDNFQATNVDLIKTLADQQIDDLRGILQEAEAGAWLSSTLRDTIQQRLQVTKSKAEFLARDQTLKLNSQITETRQTNAGITEYWWSTSEDERVRPDHEALDGTLQQWAVAPIVDVLSGRTAHPGGDYQCRCVAIPRLPELGE